MSKLELSNALGESEFEDWLLNMEHECYRIQNKIFERINEMLCRRLN